MKLCDWVSGKTSWFMKNWYINVLRKNVVDYSTLKILKGSITMKGKNVYVQTLLPLVLPNEETVLLCLKL